MRNLIEREEGDVNLPIPLKTADFKKQKKVLTKYALILNVRKIFEITFQNKCSMTEGIRP